MSPFISPDQIIIPENRYRTDFTCVEARAKEIKDIGQFDPILVRNKSNGEYPDDSRTLVLIDGECRIRACKSLNRDVWYTTNAEGGLQVGSEAQHRLLELMSNVARQDMSPVEKSKAISDVDKLMKETFGQAGQNVAKSDQPETIPGEEIEAWSIDKTAKLLGYKSRRTVIEAKMIAAAAETMPELSQAKTVSEASKMIQVKVRLEAQGELARRNAEKPQTGPITNPREYFSKRIILGDCLEGMKQLQPGICGIFLTDIPYGIDYKTEDLKDGKSAKKNLMKKVAGLYHDLPEDILPLVEGVIQQMARTGRPNCFVYMFCAYRYWTHLSIIFEQNGFDVCNKPITWVRGDLLNRTLEPGTCNNPGKWPGSNSDCILFASRGNAALAKQGQPDVIICPTAIREGKIHSLQRPLPLLTELISRVFHPETKNLLIDPFAGSGSSLAAAMQFDGLSYLGYELDPQNRERAVDYLINVYTKKYNPEPESDGLDLEL